MLAELDVNGRGDLDFSELVDADLVAVARALVPTLVGVDPGPPLGSDAAATSLTDAYQSFLSTQLELGQFNEDVSATVPILGLSGDPAGFLASLAVPVPAIGLFGAIGILLALALWSAHRRIR